MSRVKGKWYQNRFDRGGSFSLTLFVQTFQLRIRNSTLLSLSSTSRHFRKLWLPFLLQDVKVDIAHVDSLLLLLWKNWTPGQNLRGIEFTVDHQADGYTQKLTSVRRWIESGHPDLEGYLGQMGRTDDILSFGRSLILVECPRVKSLSLWDKMLLKAKILNPPRSPLSESITHLNMTADEDHPNPASDFPLWFGKQVIFLLIFLPQLESAQLKCVFDRSE